MERRLFFKKISIASWALMFAPTVFVAPPQDTYNEIYLLMEEFMERQRYYNKILTLQDKFFYYAAKGEQIPFEFINEIKDYVNAGPHIINMR